jgi:hypothetical protein
MSRDDGFKVADTDTGLHADPKVVALARKLGGGIRTAAAMSLYEAVRLASWRLGERVAIEEALPAWFLDDPSDLVAALRQARLVDDEGRIPEHAWVSWFGPALDRRLGADFGRIVGGLVAHGMTKEEAIIEARRRQAESRARLLGPASQPGSTTRLPSVPSVPPIPSDSYSGRVDSRSGIPERSRPGSTAWQRETDELMQLDFEARKLVDAARAAAG